LTEAQKKAYNKQVDSYDAKIQTAQSKLEKARETGDEQAIAYWEDEIESLETKRQTAFDNSVAAE